MLMPLNMAIKNMSACNCSGWIEFEHVPVTAWCATQLMPEMMRTCPRWDNKTNGHLQHQVLDTGSCMLSLPQSPDVCSVGEVQAKARQEGWQRKAECNIACAQALRHRLL